MSFAQPLYVVDEGDEAVQILLVLSNSLSIGVTIEVTDIAMTTNGE